MKTIALPSLINPYRNPLLKWVFGPLSFLIGVALLVGLYSERYYFEMRSVENCTVNIAAVPKGDVNTFRCNEVPGLNLNLTRRAAPASWDLLPFLAGQTVSVRYRHSLAGNVVESIAIHGRVFRGTTSDDQPILLTIIIAGIGLFALIGGLWLFFFESIYKNGDFERGYIARD